MTQRQTNAIWSFLDECERKYHTNGVTLRLPNLIEAYEENQYLNNNDLAVTMGDAVLGGNHIQLNEKQKIDFYYRWLQCVKELR